MTERPLRVGVVGTGSIAQVVHLPLLQQIDDAVIGAVGDVDRAKARAIASRFGVETIHESDEELLTDESLDAVVISSPSHLHEEQAIAALEAGKHVLVEKPLALDPEGVRRVIEAAETSDRTVMVAMNNRYRPDVLALKPFLTGGELGDIFFMKGGWWNRKVRVSRPTWRHRRRTAGGGALVDLGVQILDLCLWLLDYPAAERIVCRTHRAEGLEVEDSAAILLSLEGGVTLSIEVTWALLAERDRHAVQILGSRGSGSLSPLVVKKEVEHGLLDVTPQLGAARGNVYTASYRGQLEHFLAVARGESEAELPRDQEALMRIIHLAYRSAQEGREVEA